MEGRHSRDFVHALGAVEELRFSNDFGVSFLTGGGTLEPPGRPWMTRWGRRLIFLCFLSVRGCLLVSLWSLWAPLGLPWGDLRRHFGDRSWQRRLKKKASGAHCIPESILKVKRHAPGRQKTHRTHRKFDRNLTETTTVARHRFCQISVKFLSNFWATRGAQKAPRTHKKAHGTIKSYTYIYIYIYPPAPPCEGPPGCEEYGSNHC